MLGNFMAASYLGDALPKLISGPIYVDIKISSTRKARNAGGELCHIML